MRFTIIYIASILFVSAAATVGLSIATGTYEAKADTLVCEVNKFTENRIVIYTTNSSDISRVSAGTEFSYVSYEDGRYTQLSSETFTCHRINGDSNEDELELVNELLTVLTGGGLE